MDGVQCWRASEEQEEEPHPFDADLLAGHPHGHHLPNADEHCLHGGAGRSLSQSSPRYGVSIDAAWISRSSSQRETVKIVTVEEWNGSQTPMHDEGF